MYIEFKRPKTGKVSDKQAKVIQELTNAGHLVFICDNFENAIEYTKRYIEQPKLTFRRDE